VALAKKYGIATPYTSYLIVPDAPVPVAGRPIDAGGPGGYGMGGGMGGGFFRPQGRLGAVRGMAPAQGTPPRVMEIARAAKGSADGLAANRDKLEQQRLQADARRPLTAPPSPDSAGAFYL